jgi:hypothetical protein
MKLYIPILGPNLGKLLLVIISVFKTTPKSHVIWNIIIICAFIAKTLKTEEI